MLSEEQKNAISDAYKRASESLPGFVPRLSQRHMVGAVARTLAKCDTDSKDRPTLVVEAPTGTGKTLAYVIPALILAQEKGRSLVISTSTTALQDQLVCRDIPAFLQATGLEATVVKAKGRGQYACNAKLSEASGDSGEQVALIDGVVPAVGEPTELAAKLHKALSSGSWNGERDTSPEDVSDEQWRRYTMPSSGCSGALCPKYEHCSFRVARSKLKQTGLIIVANHALVLADLANGSNILPSPDEAFFIFDEGHALPAQALNQASERILVSDKPAWLAEFKATLSAAASNLPVSSKAYRRFLADGDRVVADYEQAMKDVYTAFYNVPDLQRPAQTPSKARLYAGGDDAKVCLRFTDGVVLEWAEQPMAELKSASDELNRLVSSVARALKEAVSSGHMTGRAGGQLIQRLGPEADRIDAIAQAADTFCRKDNPDRAPMARWIEASWQNRKPSFSVNVCSTSAAGTLRGLLWRTYSAGIICSATLTSLQTFHRFRGEAGLPEANDTVEFLRLPSPFNFSSLGLVQVPQIKSDPKDREGFTLEVGQLMPRLLSPRVGSLVLFCSKWQMKAVADSLPSSLKDRVLMQGDINKARLLELHRNRIDANQGSIIFAVASFAEGIDLPGRYLEHVIIVKLPFGRPDNPVAEATAEWVEKRGGNAFMQITLPETSLKLIQAVGRLIRREDDRGIVTLLDPRLMTKRYGVQLLDALPPFPRLIGDHVVGEPESLKPVAA